MSYAVVNNLHTAHSLRPSNAAFTAMPSESRLTQSSSGSHGSFKFLLVSCQRTHMKLLYTCPRVQKSRVLKSSTGPGLGRLPPCPPDRDTDKCFRRFLTSEYMRGVFTALWEEKLYEVRGCDLIDLAVIRWLVVVVHLVHVLHVLLILRVFLTVLLILIVLLLLLLVPCLDPSASWERWPKFTEWGISILNVDTLPQIWASRWASGCCLSRRCSAAAGERRHVNSGAGGAEGGGSRRRCSPRSGAAAPAGAARSRPHTVGPSWTRGTRLSGGRGTGTEWTCLADSVTNNAINPENK